MKGLMPLPGSAIAPMTFGYVDHFLFEDTAAWTTTATDTGSSAVGDAAGGVLVLLPSDGTVADNDEVYFFNVSEVFRIAAGKPLSFAARVQFSQAATNAANVYVGLMDAWAADALRDNGLGPKTSFSGAGFFCKDGNLLWHVIYSDGATQTIQELNATACLKKEAMAAASSTYQLLEIDIVPKTSTLVDVIFKINGSTVFKMLDRTYANATEIASGVGVKNGSANQQAVNVDLLACAQTV